MLDRTRPGAIAWDTSGPHAATPAAVLAALDAAGVGALVGPHGTGKSTLLVHLERAVTASGRRASRVKAPGRDEHGRRPPRWETAAALAEAKAAIDGLEPHDVLLLDSADRVGRIARWRLVRAARRRHVNVLLVAHRELGVPTLHHRQVDAGLARRLAAGLLADGSTFPLPDAPWFAAALSEHRGNLRAVFGRLYDRYEEHAARERAAVLG